MKSKAQKYEEAVSRNIASVSKKKLTFSDIDKAKMHIGIRSTDDQFNSAIAGFVDNSKK